MLRVLHLVGSAVDDFYVDLSRLYAGDCLRSTNDPARYDFRIAYVTPDRRWRFPADLTDEAIAAAPAMPLERAVARLRALDIDVVVPQMFCVPGMTLYRALFDLLEIPYVGNRPVVMALAADKARAKAVVAAAGVRVPAGEVLSPGERPASPLPLVVKPVDADNSLGVTLVRDRATLDDALTAALTHGTKALAESYVELGREVRCGILVRAGEPVCLPLEEYAVDAERAPIRSYGDKLGRTPDGALQLTSKASDRSWPVDVDDPVTQSVWDAARRCHEALGCRDYSLFDFRIDPQGTPWFLEAGLYNSFASTSVLTTMARAGGLSLPDVFGEMILRATGQQP